MTDEEFAGKVDYEGGIFAALEYGLHTEDLDDQDGDLAEAWRRLEEAWRGGFEALVEEAQSELDEHLEAW